MKIIITEEQKNKLFIPRKLTGENSRWSEWNKTQPDITINGQYYELNRYDLDGNKIGIWLNDPTSIMVNYNKTKPFMSNIFNNLELKGEYYVIRNDIYMKQELKYGYIWVDYYKIWGILREQYSLSREQVKDLIKIWMEEAFKLGSLTPFISWSSFKNRMEEHYKLGSLTPILFHQKILHNDLWNKILQYP
jgi:hypothetical protein